MEAVEITIIISFAIFAAVFTIFLTYKGIDSLGDGDHADTKRKNDEMKKVDEGTIEALVAFMTYRQQKKGIRGHPNTFLNLEDIFDESTDIDEGTRKVLDDLCKQLDDL